MSEPDPPDGDVTDERVVELLAELAHDPELERPDLTGRVVRTARWQRTFRRVFGHVGSLLGGMTQGTAGMLGVRKNREDRER